MVCTYIVVCTQNLEGTRERTVRRVRQREFAPLMCACSVRGGERSGLTAVDHQAHYFRFVNIDQLNKGFTTELISLTFRTISLGIIAALVALIFSLILTLSNRQNKNLLMRLITFPAGIGYAIPGTILAISLITISRLQ